MTSTDTERRKWAACSSQLTRGKPMAITHHTYNPKTFSAGDKEFKALIDRIRATSVTKQSGEGVQPSMPIKMPTEKKKLKKTLKQKLHERAQAK